MTTQRGGVVVVAYHGVSIDASEHGWSVGHHPIKHAGQGEPVGEPRHVPPAAHNPLHLRVLRSVLLDLEEPTRVNTPDERCCVGDVSAHQSKRRFEPAAASHVAALFDDHSAERVDVSVLEAGQNEAALFR